MMIEYVSSHSESGLVGGSHSESGLLCNLRRGSFGNTYGPGISVRFDGVVSSEASLLVGLIVVEGCMSRTASRRPAVTI